MRRSVGSTLARVAASVAAAIVVLSGAWGCQPTIKVDVGFGDGVIRESVVARDEGSPAAKVAIIDVRGLIADAAVPTLLGPGANPTDRLTQELDRAAADPLVRAVILRINSPGGTVTGSDTMYAEVRRFAERTGRPVVASLGEIATSGGFYVAMAADRIVAQPTTLTGSVGVIFPTVNLSRGLNSIGIVSRSVTSGPNKDLANPLEPMRDGQFAVLQGLVDEYHARFKALVKERRPGLAPSDHAEAFDGRVFSGRRAKELGLVDELGTVRDAFEVAKRLADIPAARLVQYSRTNPPAASPYALGPARVGTEINLMQIRLDGAAGGVPGWSGGGFYYLWVPPTP